jgi:thiol-disulfide isomerase/thioredoxin
MNAISSLAAGLFWAAAALAAAGDLPPNHLPSAGSTTLLEFASSSCPHCQSMRPIVQQLAAQGVAVQVVHVEQQLAVAQQYQVKGVPTFVALRGGQELGRLEGVTTADKLAELVQGGIARTQAPAAATIPASGGLPPEQLARAATVRLKVEDAAGYGFGTGTIIDMHDNEALVITCGHLFRESKGQGKITADLFSSGAAQSAEGQLISYDLDRDIALVSLRTPVAIRPVTIAAPGYAVRPGDRVFTIGCDKGADPSLRPTYITAVNKYQGRPNFTAAGQPVDGRSGGGLFSAEGHLIGICNAADPADDEGLYAGLASIHWQLDQIGQGEIYQRGARLAAAVNEPAHMAAPPASPSSPSLAAAPPPLASMPASFRSAPDEAPVMAAGDDTEIVFIVRSKRDPAQRSEVYVVDQAPPDLIARISHAARTTGQQRAAVAQAAAQAGVRSVAAAPPAAEPRLVRGQSTDSPRAW